MATPTWSQLTFLTANQQTLAAQFAAIGNAVSVGATPDISSLTQSQAKAAAASFHDLMSLIGPAQTGIMYVKKMNEAAALAAYQAANP